MRTFIMTLLVSLGIISACSAQTITTYKHISVTLSAGASLQASGNGGGGAISLEPAYAFGSNRLGVKLEMAVMDMKNIGSTVFTYDRYLLNSGPFRISAGAGMGFYNSQPTGGCSPGPGSIGQTVNTMNPFGGLGRLGLAWQHLQLGIDYNIVSPVTKTDVDIESKPTGSKTYQNSYWNFHLGIIIGGGKRK